MAGGATHSHDQFAIFLHQVVDTLKSLFYCAMHLSHIYHLPLPSLVIVTTIGIRSLFIEWLCKI